MSSNVRLSRPELLRNSLSSRRFPEQLCGEWLTEDEIAAAVISMLHMPGDVRRRHRSVGRHGRPLTCTLVEIAADAAGVAWYWPRPATAASLSTLWNPPRQPRLDHVN